MTVVQLLTPHEVFTSLHQAADTRKQTIRVSSEALRTLLIDHTTMYNALRNGMSKVQLPVTRRERPKLRP